MSGTARFSATARALHWVMAMMILAMLFIGIGMVTTTTHYAALVAIHRPLGVAILLLAVVRLAYRLLRPPPPLPAAMPRLIGMAAYGSHVALYALMFAVPLIGWALLSAGAYPVELYGALHLPDLLPHNAHAYATLRGAHTVLALLLLLVFLLHVGAALAHALIFRDGVFESMASMGKE